MAPVKNMVYFVSFILLILLSAGPVCADEIHTWIDKKGTINITDKPPDGPARVIDSRKYEPPSPDEIRKYEEKKRIQRSRREAREELEKYNQAIEDEKRARANRLREWNEAKRGRDLDREKRAKESIEIEKARLQAIENRDYREAKRQRMKLERLELERQSRN